MTTSIRQRCFLQEGLGDDRRGATLVEAAVVLLVLLMLVLGVFDLGIGVYRRHQVAEAARQGARLAIVHGELAPPAMPAWGAQTLDVTAAANGIPIVAALRRGALGELTDPGYFIGLNLDQTQIRVEWLDGNNALGSRVRVTVSTPFQPIVTLSTTYTLTATSTMSIAH